MPKNFLFSVVGGVRGAHGSGCIGDRIKSFSQSKVAKIAESASIKVLSVHGLLEAKRFALRRGVWFRVLNRVERGVVDLTMKYVDNIKGTLLAKVLMAILEKLKLATEGIAERLVRTVGVSLAQKMSCIAMSWGNLSASKWAKDNGFALHLVVNACR